MPFTRKSVKYNSAGLFLTDSPEIVGQEIEQLHFFNRVQSANVSIGVNRQNIKQLGSKEFIDRKIVSEFDVNLSFDYLLTDGTEEHVLGLGVSSGVFGTLDDGSEPNIPCLKNSESNPLSPNIYRGLKDNKNAFLVIGAEEFDLTGYIGRDYGFSGTDCISVSNCYLTNYNISAAVGSFAKASVQMKASNVTYSTLNATTIEELAALLLEIDLFDTDFVRLEEGGKILLGDDLAGEDQKHLNGHTFGSLDLVQSGSGITGTLFSFDPEMYTSAASAIPPGGINVYLEDITMGGPVIGTDTTGMYHSGEGNVQSIDISVPFERENLMGFSSMNAYGRKMKYPQLGKVSVSLLQDAFTSGTLQDMLCDDNEYNMNVYLNNDCASIFGGEDASSTFMQFQVSNMKLDGYSLGNAIGQRGTVNCDFSFEMSPERGLKIRSSAPNPKLPCGEYPPREPEATPEFIEVRLESYSDSVKYGRAKEKQISKDYPPGFGRVDSVDKYYEKGEKVRAYLSYDFTEFACHKAAVMFEPLDHNNQELKKFMENQGRTVYRSANSSSPEVHFSEEWIEGMPSFDSAGNMDGSSIEGFFYTYRDEHDLTNVSTAYIDFEIGEESGLLPIYYKTKNWQGDFSYHMSVPIGPLGEIYRPPYAILVIN
tara:strand:+ start:9271 stop:11223 length:1953 start_codon:yes stop_codon:yes gene_type:complete